MGKGLGNGAVHLAMFHCPFPPSGWVILNQPLISLYLQLGTFRSHDGDYFIEPLLSIDEQEGEEEQNKPHVIYRRSTPHREPSTGRRACDTSGICFFPQQRPPAVWAGLVARLQRCSPFTGCRALPFTLSFTQSSSQVGISPLYQYKCGDYEEV